MFTGEESYLVAELVDTENLLVAARVPDIDRVDVVKIQLSCSEDSAVRSGPISVGGRGKSFAKTCFLEDICGSILGHVLS